MRRPGTPSRRLRLVGLLVCVAALAACSGPSAGPKAAKTPVTAPTSSPAGSHCSTSALLVPTCGVLFGLATQPPTPQNVASIESQVGRPFDFVYRYHDVQSAFPNAAERQWVAEGKTLHIALAARDFSSNDRLAVSWGGVASGKYDADLRQQAQGIAALGVPIFMTFEQEANQKAKLGPLGSAAQFKAAWRHVWSVYRAAGATNAVWVWVMTGSADNLASAGKLWPGNDVVDWISWNVYNQSGCPSGRITTSQYMSFADKMSIFYDWLHSKGPALGIDVNKPLMISEAGSAHYPGDSARTAQWYGGIADTLAQYPQIKAIALWDSVDGKCDYRFQTDSTILGGVQDAVQQPQLTQRVRLATGSAQP